MSLEKLIQIRKHLHKNPELSGKEEKTSNYLIEKIKTFNPSQIISNLGGYGFIVIFDSNVPGPTIAFRGDIDALPIQETNTFGYASVKQGVSHKCGHDGHATILIGLAQKISEQKIKKGKVILIFQAEEETGEGAAKLLNDPKFKDIEIDYVFALHNLPGFPKHSILLKHGTFAYASKGLIIKLTGKTSHAGYPEDGISPAIALAKLINEFHDISNNRDIFEFPTFLTIVYSKMGEIAFGTAPGHAELMATLRSYSDNEMEILAENCTMILKNICSREKLKYTIEWTEEFPTLVNEESSITYINNAAQKNNYKIIELKEAFRFSEDFAHFTNKYKGAILGLGAGENHPQLHNPDYDFPDEIIPTGIQLFWEIINSDIS